MKCRNWKGKLVNAPKDFANVVASYADSYIVWSKHGKKHRVRYGLQVNNWGAGSIAAAEDFGRCIHHFAECEGLLS